jgi:predicted acylesterase/phospholipase RssA
VSERAYEHGPREEECDLVMKGGITSGVVYPSAIRKIAGRYRFRNLGGASAGAIAAVAAAACEYRWNQGEPAAYDALGEVSDEITGQGFVLSLFQPTPAARPAFDVALRFVTSKGSLARRGPAALVSILRGRKLFLAAAALAVLAWVAVVVIAVWALAGGGLGALDWVAIVLLVGATLVAVPAVLTLIALVALGRFALALNGALSANWIGMCTGRTESGQPEYSGLTDWLHKTIQHCAGLPLDRPLTFRMLQGKDPKNPDVNLALVTTDLSASRPVTLPFSEPDEEKAPYLFDPEELERLFPPEVVTHMTAATQAGARKYPKADGKERTLYPVPGLDLPIVVAARLSLSFPVLLSTVPLWRNDPHGGPLRHTMSDGGICSNFPIHFFDALFPSRPTFGLDLQPWRRPDLPPVEMSDNPRLAGFTKVADVMKFFPQLLNAARNWRDNTQAELPGYRDRVCQIRLTDDEGGLNLSMPKPVVDGLIKRGQDAGELVIDPNGFDWNRHRVTRYWIMMQMLQRSLGAAGVGREGVYRGAATGARVPFRDVVEEWRKAGLSPVDPPPLAWWEAALAASDELFDLAATWGPPAERDFDTGAPTPTPTIRILPRS